MGAIKFSSKIDEAVWKELQVVAEESHQSISGLLTEAVREYLQRRRIRPDTLRHLADSMGQHDELGRLLAE